MHGTFNRYRDALIIFIGILVLLSLLTIYGRNAVTTAGYDLSRMDVTPLLPITKGWGGLTILFIIPISAMIGTFLGGYLMSPLYLIFHQEFYRKMNYGLQEFPQSKSFRHIYKGFYPTLLSINIGSIILFSSEEFFDRLLVPSLLLPDVDFPLKFALGSLVLMMFTVGLSMFIFSPTWFLIDAGIVYSTNVYVDGKGVPKEVRAVGGWFYDYIKGYSGFSVVFSYLQLLLTYYYFELGRGYPVDILEIVFIVGIPFFVTLLLIPSFILLDITKKNRSQFTRKIARRRGINKFIETILDEKVFSV
jgi:hypothetical protein